MEKFTIINSKSVNDATQYGLVSINNIFVKPEEFNDVIVGLVSNWDNLYFMFNTISGHINKLNIIDRFLPSHKPDDLEEYISLMINENNGFYSFLAEGIQSLLLRDAFGYNLSIAAIDINSNLSDQHTGVDVCMVDLDKKVFVLGEAKFMKNISNALNEINDCFTKDDSLASKIDNMYRISKNNNESYSVMIEEVGSSDITELDIDAFVNLKFVFSGFVLHENHLKNPEKYLKKEYYDFWKTNSEGIKNKISALFSDPKGNYCLNIFHLPISNKKVLIKKVITKFYELKEKENVQKEFR